MSAAAGRLLFSWLPRTQQVSVAMFVLMEAVAWWIALRGLGTALTRDGYASLAERLTSAQVPGVEPAELQRAIDVARDAAAHGTGGPPLLVVLATAACAFLLVRWIVQQQLPVAMSAAIGVVASLVVFQVLVHLAVAGDARVWEPIRVLQAPGSTSLSRDTDLSAFITAPDTSLPVRGALTTTVGGLALAWLRFLLAGRGGPVTYERVLRSFGSAFAVLILLGAWVSLGEGVDAFTWVPLHFVLGVAALAVAQAARARPAADTARRVEPWVASILVTLGGIAAVALLFALLAFIDGERLFAPVVTAVVWVVGRLAWIVLYPFAVVMQWVLNLILGGRVLQFNELRLDLLEPPQPPGGQQERGPLIPSWLAVVLRTLAILVAGWVLYRVGLVVFAARRRFVTSAEGAESRSAAAAEAPRGLLRGLFRRRRADDGISGAWLRRHEVYELFARVVRASRERGVERAAGSTPIEFAREAAIRLDASAFEPIGRAFDQARYGRHFPERAEVDAMERSLAEWEHSDAARETRRDERASE